METFSALLALCAGNSPVTGEFPSQRPVTRSFDVFFDHYTIFILIYILYDFIPWPLAYLRFRWHSKDQPDICIVGSTLKWRHMNVI